MSEGVFYIGGCKCGKSRLALEAADAMNASPKVFIATCQPLDDEMRTRVRRHQEERGRDWITVEAPLDLPGAVRENARPGAVLLVDCLTLWITNRLLAGDGEAGALTQADALVRAVHEAPCPVILVSNETGAGIVPENALARLFRDAAGQVNQRVAAACRAVHWVVAGIGVPIKEG